MNGQTLSLLPLEDGFVELRFDRQRESVNKFDALTLGELGEAVALLRRSAALRGVLVTSGKPSFIVGADIFELATLFRRPAGEIAAEIARHSAIFSAFEDLPVPSVAVLNGMSLGGGFEFALAADYRVAEPGAQVGLPEVTLGIFPGYGGTVRLPRLIDFAEAASWIVSGQPKPAAKALAAGAIDAIADSGSLRQEALALLAKAAEIGGWRERRQRRQGPIANFDPARLADIKAHAETQGQHFPAPLAAVNQIADMALAGRDAALRREAAGIAAMGKTATAGALIQIFINGQALKKGAASFARQGRTVRRAGILGAGIMGGGIAFTSASKGVPVLMKDIAQAALDAGLREADGLLSRQTAQGRITEEKARVIRQSIETRLDYRDFGSVDFVVEAVVENLAIKRTVLAEAERNAAAGAILVSNTSSLSIGALAEAVRHPENFAGMHFFNPVPIMPLVEVIRGPLTSDATAATVAAYASAMGKTPIVVRDCPGFLVNRVLIAGFVGFLGLLRDGADFQQVDRVMEAAGWPMGPAYLQDVIGIDTCVHVIDFITAGYGERMAADFPHAVKRLAEAGRLGQKNGAGFYRYARGEKGRLVKETDPETAPLLAALHTSPRSFDDAEIFDRMMLPFIHEAALCLSEGVAGSAAEIDMAMVLGLSFPRHLGGPLKFADRLGAAALVAKAEALGHLGPLYAAPAILRELAASGKAFYEPPAN